MTTHIKAHALKKELLNLLSKNDIQFILSGDIFFPKKKEQILTFEIINEDLDDCCDNIDDASQKEYNSIKNSSLDDAITIIYTHIYQTFGLLPVVKRHDKNNDIKATIHCLDIIKIYIIFQSALSTKNNSLSVSTVGNIHFLENSNKYLNDYVNFFNIITDKYKCPSLNASIKLISSLLSIRKFSYGVYFYGDLIRELLKMYFCKKYKFDKTHITTINIALVDDFNRASPENEHKSMADSVIMIELLQFIGEMYTILNQTYISTINHKTRMMESAKSYRSNIMIDNQELAVNIIDCRKNKFNILINEYFKENITGLNSVGFKCLDDTETQYNICSNIINNKLTLPCRISWLNIMCTNDATMKMAINKYIEFKQQLINEQNKKWKIDMSPDQVLFFSDTSPSKKGFKCPICYNTHNTKHKGLRFTCCNNDYCFDCIRKDFKTRKIDALCCPTCRQCRLKNFVNEHSGNKYKNKLHRKYPSFKLNYYCESEDESEESDDEDELNEDGQVGLIENDLGYYYNLNLNENHRYDDCGCVNSDDDPNSDSDDDGDY
jgi:hypothetical protein